jgi:hypothetical protein
MFRYQIGCALAALGLSFVVCAPASAAIIVDTFSGGALNVSTPPGGSNPSSANSGTLSANALGGAHNLNVTRTTGTGGFNNSIDQAGNGFWSYSSGPGDAGRGTVLYDGGTDYVVSDPGLGGIDLTQGGLNDRIVFKYRADQAGANVLGVVLYSGAGNSSTATANVNATGFAGSFADGVIPFSSFVNSSGSGASLSNISAIQLVLDGSNVPALDMQVDSVSAVPEPVMGLSLCVAGMFAGMLLRRRARIAR